MLLTVATLAMSTASASAVILALPGGKTVSYQPIAGAGGVNATPSAAASSGALQYHGGPIMPSNTNYAIYWDPSGAPAYPAEYQSGVNKYLKDLAHDSGGAQNVDSVATQYGDAAANSPTTTRISAERWSTPTPIRPTAAPRPPSA